MSVRVIHGANEGEFSLDGHTVAQAAKKLKEAFNISADASAFMNGTAVESNHVLGDGDTLEFVRTLGQKGGLHDYWSRAELIEFFGEDEVRQMEEAGMQLTLKPVLTAGEVMTWDKWLRNRQNPPDRYSIHVNTEGDALPTIRSHGVEIVRERFTVSDESGHSCFLGNTILFSLIGRLAQRSNVFVHIDVLKQDVWKDDHVADETVMRTARSLRAKLRQAGIVAVTVNTSQKQHVALMRR